MSAFHKEPNQGALAYYVLRTARWERRGARGEANTAPKRSWDTASVPPLSLNLVESSDNLWPLDISNCAPNSLISAKAENSGFMALISMIDEINVAVDCSDRQCSMIVNLKTMISDTGSICDAQGLQRCSWAGVRRALTAKVRSTHDA